MMDKKKRPSEADDRREQIQQQCSFDDTPSEADSTPEDDDLERFVGTELAREWDRIRFAETPTLIEGWLLRPPFRGEWPASVRVHAVFVEQLTPGARNRTPLLFAEAPANGLFKLNGPSARDWVRDLLANGAAEILGEPHFDLDGSQP